MIYTVRQHYAMGEPTGRWEVCGAPGRYTAVCQCFSEVEARLIAAQLEQITTAQYDAASKRALAEMATRGAA